jgi:hypothetical protein
MRDFPTVQQCLDERRVTDIESLMFDRSRRARGKIMLRYRYEPKAGLRVMRSARDFRHAESRLAGVDTNPYLAIAAGLACGCAASTARSMRRHTA